MRVDDVPALLLWLIPFSVAAVYAVVFVLQFRHNLWVLQWNADYVSTFTIAETIAKTGFVANTIIGSAGGYVALWFGLLTAGLPLHHELWNLAPTAVFILMALAVAWSVAQVANRRAAALAALLILVAAPRALYLFIAPIPHSMITYAGTAFLGAYLIWLTKGEGRRAAVTWTAAPLVGIALGTYIASDYLLVATGVIPFAIAAVLAAARRDRDSRVLTASALTTVAIAIPVAKLTSAIMDSLGFANLSPPVTLAPLSELPLHAELMWEGLKGLFNGYLSQTPYEALGVACEALTAAALATVLAYGVFTTAQFLWRCLRRDGHVVFARSLHIIYWAGSAGVTSAAFALSIRTEEAHGAYYATLVLSVAAIVVLFMRGAPPVRWLVSAGTSVFFAASIVGLTSHYMENYLGSHYVPPIAGYVTQIANFARANDATVGYAGYDDGPPLTWISDERVLVRPVQECRTPTGIGICPFFNGLIPSAYRPERRRTFLLVDSSEHFLTSLPAGLGKPLATGSFGPVQVYVYPYDLASTMGPPLD